VATWLANGEVGSLALGNLAFLPRKRRANQAAVHRAVILRGAVARVVIEIEIDVGVDILVITLRDHWHFERLPRLDLLVFVLQLLVLAAVSHGRTRAQRAFDVARQRGVGLPPTGRWRLRLLVFVVRVARGAARLLDLIVDHRDDRMVGDAALARTIVVQNVTEPKPALLH